MLILTRRVGEKIFIGNEVEIIILKVKGNQTRIGFNAPYDIKIYREEIYEKIKMDEKENINKSEGIKYEK